MIVRTYWETDCLGEFITLSDATRKFSNEPRLTRVEASTYKIS